MTNLNKAFGTAEEVEEEKENENDILEVFEDGALDELDEE